MTTLHELDLVTTSILQATVLAPSSHNTQPWRLTAHEGEIELYADRRRGLPVNDPHDRELTISCGSALLNLRVAAAHYGLATEIELLPDGPDSEHLAHVRIRDPHGLDAPRESPLASLFGAIVERRTYRRRFADSPVSERARRELSHAAENEGARLRFVTETTERHAVATLAARGDALQWADARWRRELASWMHPLRSDDGLLVAGVATPLTQAIVRTFDMGRGVGAKDLELAEASPLLAILTTTCDSVIDWLRAGQALERVLLAACGLGLQASFLNQACQLDELRAELRTRLAETEHPQIVLRMGFPIGQEPATGRRSLRDVVG